MARNLNDRLAKANADKEKERNERYDKLETEIIGSIGDILDSVFPQTATGDPDWDKFNWDRAEQLKRQLDNFQKNPRDSRRQPDDDQSEQQQRPARRERSAAQAQPRPTPAPAPQAPAVAPEPDSDDEPGGGEKKAAEPTSPMGWIKKRYDASKSSK